MTLFDRYVAYRKNNSLTYNLMRYVIFCSAAFTVFATALQLYVQYGQERGLIQSNITFIQVANFFIRSNRWTLQIESHC